MIAADLWPYVVILFAGWFATDFWRWLGVLAGNRLSEGSEALNWVRAVARFFCARPAVPTLTRCVLG